MSENPPWFIDPKIAGPEQAENPAIGDVRLRETEDGGVIFPESALLASQYEESDQEKEKIDDLRGVLAGKKSTQIQPSGMPLFMEWNEAKKAFEESLNDQGFENEYLRKVRLYHVLIGSSHIEGLPIERFDLPGEDRKLYKDRQV
jgi:hypothetical protein